MTQEEYNRLKRDIDVLIKALAILDGDSAAASCMSAHERRNYVWEAIFLCQDRLPDIFRAKMSELIAERDNI